VRSSSTAPGTQTLKTEALSSSETSPNIYYSIRRRIAEYWNLQQYRVELTTLPLSSADCLEIRKPQLPGTLWACPGIEGLLFLLRVVEEQGFEDNK
jgi:hypothetical protein